MTELSEIMTNLDIKADETQTYLHSSSESESSSSSSDASSKKKENSGSATIQRLKFNEFLCASGKNSEKTLEAPKYTNQERSL